jgi:phosphohistidine swiveling domain-containing protein
MEPAPWELIGRPHGGWSDAQRMLFDCWDEYNPPAIQPLEMDLFMGAIWQASLDMLDDGSGVPEIEKATVLIDGVPVQIDPTGGQIDNCNRWPRGEVRNDLLETMGWGAKMIRELRGQLEAAALPSSTDLLKALNECASVHRTLGVTRLRFMQTWIAGESDAKSALEPLLSRIDANTELLLEQLLAGVDTETRRMNQDLQSLAKQFNDKGTTQFSKALSEFLERYGHFQSDGIPLSETHESLLKQIRTIAESSDLKTTENIASRIAIVTNGICSKIPPESQESFRMALNDLRYWYNVREDSKTKVEIARPLLRELVIELGRRFVSEKVLSKAEQIWLLRSIEVQNAIRGLHTPDSAILERREALVAWKAKQSWLPGGFVTELCRPTDHEWKGLSGSPGKALGCVRLVNGPQEFGNVRNGEIVVARSTNPVWTQLFGQISAIIVENGSRLSHAAIVAREYGIPCVVGLPGITAALKTGELITVDGDAGKVFRSKQSVKVDHLN